MMRQRTLMALVLICIVAVGSGCSRSTKRDVYLGPGGKATVTDKGGQGKTVQVETREGKVTVDTEKKTITEKELGVPVYPGATVEVTGGFEGKTNDQESMHQTVLTSSDDFEKVYNFYTSHLKKIETSMNQQGGEENMAMFTVKSSQGEPITVHVMADKQKKVTRIMVMKMPKPKE